MKQTKPSDETLKQAYQYLIQCGLYKIMMKEKKEKLKAQ